MHVHVIINKLKLCNYCSYINYYIVIPKTLLRLSMFDYSEERYQYNYYINIVLRAKPLMQCYCLGPMTDSRGGLTGQTAL